jgi:orotidine-5'-phosphate decarboxylase
MSHREKLIVALDVGDEIAAQEIVHELSPAVGGFKVGLQLFLGSKGKIPTTRKPVILDLKLHDIPATVERAASTVFNTYPQVEGLTVHVQQLTALEALGALQARMARSQIYAVTVLTSMDATDMRRLGFIDESPEQRVYRLAQVAANAGITGLVCSPQEVTGLKQRFPAMKLLVPGIRPKGGDQHDQQRVMTPFEAVQAGADKIVVGRPILKALNKYMAAKEIVEDMDRGL